MQVFYSSVQSLQVTPEPWHLEAGLKTLALLLFGLLTGLAAQF